VLNTTLFQSAICHFEDLVVRGWSMVVGALVIVLRIFMSSPVIMMT